MEYYPKSGMFSAMGMTGPRANSGRRCYGISIWHILRRHLPRVESCAGPSVFNSTTVGYNETVLVDPITHRLMVGQTSWSFADSAQWQRTRDSVLTSLAKLGGHIVACNTRPERQWFTLGSYYWKFPDFYVKVHAMKVDWDIPVPLRWILSVQGHTEMPFECMNRPLQ